MGILGHSMTEGNHGDRNGGHLIGYGGLISEKTNVPVPVATHFILFVHIELSLHFRFLLVLPSEHSFLLPGTFLYLL